MHPQGLGVPPKIGPDTAVADHAQRTAFELDAAKTRFNLAPLTNPGGFGRLRQAPHHRHHQSQ